MRQILWCGEEGCNGNMGPLSWKLPIIWPAKLHARFVLFGSASSCSANNSHLLDSPALPPRAQCSSRVCRWCTCWCSGMAEPARSWREGCWCFTGKAIAIVWTSLTPPPLVVMMQWNCGHRPSKTCGNQQRTANNVVMSSYATDGGSHAIFPLRKILWSNRVRMHPLVKANPGLCRLVFPAHTQKKASSRAV